MCKYFDHFSFHIKNIKKSMNSFVLQFNEYISCLDARINYFGQFKKMIEQILMNKN